LRARALVEELEPRTLLATSLFGSLLAPLSSPLALLGQSFAQRPATAPVQGNSLPAVPVIANPGLVSGLGGALPVSSMAQSIPAAQTVNGVLPGSTPGNTGLGSLPSQALFPATTAPANSTAPGTSGLLANPMGPQALPGTFLTPTAMGPFTALPTGPVAPGATPGAGQTATLSPVATVVVTFLGLPGTVGLSLPQQLLALAQTGPGPTITVPNAVTEAPTFFDPAAHRLLFVVGGPEDQSPEDYRDGYEDGAVLPGPDLPRLSAIDAAPAVAREARVMAAPAEVVPPVTLAWPLLSEAYFREEMPTTAGVPTEAIERTSTGLGAATPAPVENDATEARPELLAALVGLGLLGAPSWRKEERDREEGRRRRPTVIPLGPER